MVGLGYMVFWQGKHRVHLVQDRIWTEDNGVRKEEGGASRKQWEIGPE